MLSDGRPVAGGSAGARPSTFFVARTTTVGSTNTTFDGDGSATPALGGSGSAAVRALAAQGTATIAGGESGGEAAVVRLRENGTLDTGFAGGGVRARARAAAASPRKRSWRFRVRGLPKSAKRAKVTIFGVRAVGDKRKVGRITTTRKKGDRKARLRFRRKGGRRRG